jgi:Copper type II ascorbate-dependent monooxygenase, C-terminal domain
LISGRGTVKSSITSFRGLYFAKGPIEKHLQRAVVMPPRPGLFRLPKLRIPAGNANFRVDGSWRVPHDIHLTGVLPHMHWLGKDFLLTAVLTDGSRFTLLKVDQWDFNWQDTYDFEAPVALPAGSRVELVAHFDNSEANPRNPSHPPIEVQWGEQTTDEMCIGFLLFTRDDEHLGNKRPSTSPLGSVLR